MASGCVAFSSTTPDRNVPVITRYDALGRAWESENALGQVDRTTFDGVGRTATTTRNYVNGGPSDSDSNVTTRQGYDALGRTTVITDAINVAAFRAYDALGRTSVITDAVGRASRRFISRKRSISARAVSVSSIPTKSYNRRISRSGSATVSSYHTSR